MYLMVYWPLVEQQHMYKDYLYTNTPFQMPDQRSPVVIPPLYPLMDGQRSNVCVCVCSSVWVGVDLGVCDHYVILLCSG